MSFRSIGAPGSGLSGWSAKLAEGEDDGTKLSLAGPPLNTKPPSPWLPAIVPGTVLTMLVAAGKFPDPYIGVNNLKIADLHQGAEIYTYWFVADFEVSTATVPDGRVWLRFRGINYSANVFVNGNLLTVNTPLVGMFKRHELDISDAVQRGSKKNRVAVLVVPPSPAGDPVAKKISDGPGSSCQGGDRLIGQSVTAQFTGGWDFVQPIRDRCTGIWDIVSTVETGPVSFAKDPQIVNAIKWDGNKAVSAEVTVTVSLRNTSRSPQSGNVKFAVGDVDGTQPFSINGDEPALPVKVSVSISEPTLWWPNGHGAQHLYDTTTLVTTAGGDSDVYKHRIGVRELTSTVDPGTGCRPSTGGRLFTVNKVKIFIRGGCWTFPDAMLKHSAQNYDDQVHHHAMMNMNLIRIWGGGITERPEFYNACDKYGILVWQEFWITGDCNQYGENPRDHSLFMDSAGDAIEMLRNHASLALWVGGNEGRPPGDLDGSLKTAVADLDPKTAYVSYSTDPDGGFGLEGGGPYTDGPYGIQIPKRFFDNSFTPHRRSVPGNPPVAFNPEYGSVGTPVADTIRKILPEDCDHFPKVHSKTEFSKVNLGWGAHTYIPYWSEEHRGGEEPIITPNQVDLYGVPASLDAFCEQAQAAQYQQYKAMYEGHNTHMWSWYTGHNIWRSQNGWAGLRGGLYDMFLEQTGGYYGVRSAGERIHAQLNLANGDLEVVNNSHEPVDGLTLDVRVCDETGKLQTGLSQEIKVKGPIPEIAVTKRVGSLVELINQEKLHIIRLRLRKDGKELGRNLDWTNASKDKGAFKPLRGLPKTSVEAMVINTSCEKTSCTVGLELANTSETIAFNIRLQVLDKNNGDRILPVFFTDNYVSVLPNNEEKLVINFEFEQPKDTTPVLSLAGWNTETKKIAIG